MTDKHVAQQQQIQIQQMQPSYDAKSGIRTQSCNSHYKIPSHHNNI